MTMQMPEQAMKIFIARQAIMDARQNVYAYELLFRSRISERAQAPDGEYATLKLIANSLLIGLKSLTADKIALINFDRQLLLGKIPLLFPRDQLGVEILETVEPEEKVVEACKSFKREGYLLVLDDFVFQERYRPLINLADIIKIDFHATSSEERGNIIQKVRSQNIKFLAEKIETKEEYEEALEQGYSYFQGFFFQKPDLISRIEIPGYKIHYLSILKKLYNPVLEFDEIEEIIKRDVSLTYKLLRFINSASFGFKVTINSIHHALSLLGGREVKKWLSIIVMSGIGKDKPPELMNTCVIRARFCETIAQQLNLKDQAPEFFLMGMFSLVDVFLGRPLPEILEELPLAAAIKDALLGKDGTCLQVLQLVTSFEKAEWEEVARMAHVLQLDQEDLQHFYMESVMWIKHLNGKE